MLNNKLICCMFPYKNKYKKYLKKLLGSTKRYYWFSQNHFCFD